MGELSLSTSCSEEDMVVELGKDQEIEKKGDDGSSEVVRWEKFLPRMALRVLLVEADDSTRQIIAALLRKCSYRVVAVPDGLMAWETLKVRPHNIDLILTEVELPSISGYALLTLVMEDEVCKNIPVIMMSSHDSISMVLKCMLKGAADFLIKPVRRNELRNLWQHVWRRQTLTTGQSPRNSPKVDASSENNVASNHSSDYATSSQKNKDCSETGSDAHGFSQLNYRSASNLRNTDREKFEECAKLDKSAVTSEIKTGGLSNNVAGRSNGLRPEEELYHQAYNPTVLRLGEEHTCAETVIQDESSRQEHEGGDANIPHRQDVEPCGAIDLIGSFKNDHKCTYGRTNLNDGMSRFDFTPHLELSLRRLNPCSSKNYGIDEKHALNHSNASAFSWYNSKTLQALFPTSVGNGTEFKEEASKSQELSSNQNTQNTSGVSQSHGATMSGSQEIMTTLVIGQSGKAELAYTSPQLGLIPVPGMRLNHISTGYGQAVPPVCYTQSSAAWSPKVAGPREQSPFPTSTSVHSNPEVHDSKQSHRCSDETAHNSVDQNMHQQNKMEHVDELRRDSPVTAPSTSGLCNDVANQNNCSTYGSFCSGNDGNALTLVTSEKAIAPNCLNDGSLYNNEGFRGVDSQRSNQREAALTKFRLKRKDRCYEKKVRYQSRKRLAEQRPRVKGQFVRQVQNDVPVADATS